MWPTLDLGPLAIPTGPLTVILGMWVALSLVDRAARMVRVSVSGTYTLASVGLFAGILGARLIFVALHWSAYKENLLGLIWPINSGYDPVGGVLIGLASAVLYGRWRRLPLGQTLDSLAPGILVGIAFISLSDWLAGPGYGEPTSMPWGISQFGIRRHPVQLYEIIISLTALAVWFGSLPPRQNPGRLFLVSVVIVSAGRLLVDPFRANAPLTGNGFHVVQLVSLAILMVSLALLSRMTPPSPRADTS